MEPPKTFKQLDHSWVAYTISKNSAQLSAPLRPLLSHKEKLKKNSKLDWNKEHTKSFQQIKKAIQQKIKNRHFDTNRQTRVRCDASKQGLGACLEQNYENNWYPIAYASRFQNTNEKKMQHKWTRTTIHNLAIRTFQILLIWIKIYTPKGPSSPSVSLKR